MSIGFGAQLGAAGGSAGATVGDGGDGEGGGFEGGEVDEEGGGDGVDSGGVVWISVELEGGMTELATLVERAVLNKVANVEASPVPERLAKPAASSADINAASAGSTLAENVSGWLSV